MRRACLLTAFKPPGHSSSPSSPLLLPRAQISGYRGMGALAGLAATLIFPWMGPRIGIPLTGLIGVCYQVSQWWLRPRSKALSGLLGGISLRCV